MVYTEIQEKSGKKHYYRVKSYREKGIPKKKAFYLGVDLTKEELVKKEKEADKELNIFSTFLEKDDVVFLDKLKKEFSKEPVENQKNRYESFCSLFTFDSTGIEGNTFTLSETSYLLFEGIVPSTKSLREINEVLNHKKAFDYIISYKEDINQDFILTLHSLIATNAIDEELKSQIGKYRKVQVFVGGSIPPSAEEVPKKMESLVKWYTKNKKELHPLILATYFHSEFEKIHPFVDGNGRVGRLLMNFILFKNKIPMINIPKKIRFKYYEALKSAHRNNNFKPFINLLIGILKKEQLRF